MAYKTQIERLAVVETEVKMVKGIVQDVKDNQSRNHQELSDKLSAIHGVLDNHRLRIESIEETVDPFTKFRRRAWAIVVTSTLTCAILAIVIYEIKRYKPN